jgi:hypothetical protein
MNLPTHTKFQVLKAEAKTTANGQKQYYALRLKAPTSEGGETYQAKMWQETIVIQKNRGYPLPSSGEIWHDVNYSTEMWQGEDQLIIKKYKPVETPTPEQQAEFFTPPSIPVDRTLNWLFYWPYWDRDMAVLMDNLSREMNHTGQWERLKQVPAGAANHHDVRAGLLLHIMEMVHLAEDICHLNQVVIPAQGDQPETIDMELTGPRDYSADLVDFQLLRAAIILHDIGKTHDYSPLTLTFEGDVITDAISHPQEGALMVERNWRQTDDIVSLDRKIRLQHAVISHHGKAVFSSVPPKTPEAILLHHIDAISAFLNVSQTAYNAAKQKQTPVYNKMLGDRIILPLHLRNILADK